MKMKISLAQMDILLGRPDENLAKARNMTAQAAGQGSDVIVFPELWSTGYDLENASKYAAPTDKGIFAEMLQYLPSHYRRRFSLTVDNKRHMAARKADQFS